MGYRVILAVLLLLPAMAFAQPKTMTTKQLCQQLVPYQPSADVEYKPDTDVRGRAVVPADVEGSVSSIELPETIDLAITVRQAEALGLPADIRYRPEAYIGGVSVTKNGDVYFDGKRISQTQIQVLCPPQASKKSSFKKN